jgi:CubicO group peptidase (beta-lactamase class C family)
VSAIRYWPSGLFVAIAALAVFTALLVWAAMRWRSGSPLPGLAITAACVALLAVVAASVFSIRPGFLAAPRPQSVADNGAAELPDAEQFLEALVEADAPPGLTALVVKDGELLYARGFGYADGPRGVPATPDTIYRWWSITKVFTAVAVMQLVDEGRLELDDPVARYVPDFAPTLRDAPMTGITVRQLLSHSSGLPDAGMEILGWLHFEGDPALNQTEFVRKMLPDYSRLASAPSTEGRYTNIGYMVLSAVIESVSGERYEDYVTAHILAPLGMDRTGFDYPKLEAAEVAVGSHPVDIMTVPASVAIDMKRAVRERHESRLWFERVYPDQSGPSGLIGPASDMARFMAAMLAGGVLDGTRILSEASANAMARSVIDARVSPAPGNGFDFGLGWFVHDGAGRESLSHGGQGMGMSSLMTLYPEESLGILVVGNSTYLGRDFGASAVASLAAVDWTAFAEARN